MTADRPEQFGNFEANLRFLEATGVVFPGSAPASAGGGRAKASAERPILEIGTGTGAMLHALVERGCHARGVELRQDLIDEARRWYPGLPVERVAGIALPFPDASFDVAISLDVLEHIPDTDAHLAEIARLLRPGGSYLIQTPNKWMNTAFETLRWRSFTRWREDHCSLHTLGQLRARLVRHGFAVRAYDVPVVNDFFRAKVRRYAGPMGVWAVRVANPDRLPLAWRTNLYVQATKPAR